ncbi:hypothetical protein GGR54DRAFT_158101 [Hypoxylon sp. NC1633]|nr:hypothetical protein GGR54DRAFT_158101 [Hypoxylon sp. NC1633]
MSHSSRGQETSNLAHIKKLKGDITQSSQASPTDDNILDLPEPKYREAPVDVRRRPNRTVRAEPPPSPAAQVSTTPPRRRSGREKKRLDGLDGDSGSESDDHGPKRCHGEGETSVARRRVEKKSPPNSVEPAGPSSSGPSTSTFLTLEEDKRVQMQRALQKESPRWQNVLSSYIDNRVKAENAKQDLMVAHGTVATRLKERPGPEIIRHQQRLRNFLNEALCYDMEDSLGDNDTSEDPNRELLKEVVEQIELDFALRYEGLGLRTNPDGDSEPLPSTDRLINTLKVMYEDIYSEAVTYNSIELVDRVRRRATPLGFSFNPLGTMYETGVIDELVADAKRNYSTEEWLIHDRLARRREENHPVVQHIGQGCQCPSPSPVKLLELSRRNGQLSPEYIDWIYSHAPSWSIDGCCQQRKRQIRGKDIRKLFQSTEQSRVVQIFCEDSNGISLVLFKGDRPASLRHVAADELATLGWFKDDEVGQKHCRYEFDDDLKCIFKVTMDGKVLGLVEPEAASRSLGISC